MRANLFTLVLVPGLVMFGCAKAPPQAPDSTVEAGAEALSLDDYERMLAQNEAELRRQGVEIPDGALVAAVDIGVTFIWSLWIEEAYGIAFLPWAGIYLGAFFLKIALILQISYP